MKSGNKWESQYRMHIWDSHKHRMAARTPKTLSSLTAPGWRKKAGKWFLSFSFLVIIQFLVKKTFFFWKLSLSFKGQWPEAAFMGSLYLILIQGNRKPLLPNPDHYSLAKWVPVCLKAGNEVAVGLPLYVTLKSPDVKPRWWGFLSTDYI